MNNLNIGLFYQSGCRREACYYALEQFRKWYPDAPVALYEDNTNFLRPVARKFKCNYKITDKKGTNLYTSGRPAFNLETTLAWIDRVYDACMTTLKSVEWVIHFEDDVWFKSTLKGTPPYDLTGIYGIGAQKELYEYLGAKYHSTFGCGGAIFNRRKFLLAYEEVPDIDWDLLDDLASKNNEDLHSPKPSMWTDSALTVIFLYAGMTVGPWDELSQYKNSKMKGTNDRYDWYGTMNELESEQPEKSNVIHCWKPYYFPTKEEIEYVEKELQQYTYPEFL